MAKKNRGTRPPVVNVTSSTTVEVNGGISSAEFQSLLNIQTNSLQELQGVRKLLELSKEMSKAGGDSSSAGASPQRIQIDILGQIKEQVKQSRKYYKSQEEFEAEWRKEARDIAEMSKGMRTFKTLGEKLQDKKDGIKGALSADSLKSGLLKSLNFGGMLDKVIAKGDFIKQQKALGSGQSNKSLGADFEAHNNALKASKKNEAEISKVKTAAKTDNEDLLRQKNPEFAALLDKRREHADTLSTHNRAYDAAAPKSDGPIRRIDDRGMAPIPTANKSSTQTAAEQTQGAEQQEEQMRAVGHQTELLEKIEKNTGGKSADQKAQSASGEGGGGILAGIGAGLKAIGGGLKGFGEGAGKGIKGLLTGIAEGIAAFGKTNVIKGAAAMVILAGALYITGKALQEFGKVEWESIAKGGVALLGLAGIAMLLGKGSTEMIKGGLAIAILGGALWVAGKGFQTFAELDWETIGKGLVALLGLGAVAAVLGLALPFIIPGAIAIGALGLALVPFAAAMALAGPAMDEFASGMERLSKISGDDLLKIALGIGAVGVAMAAFGAGQAVAGLGNLVGRFLTLGTDSPVDQLIKIGNAGEGVMKAAQGLSKLSDAMQGFGKVDKKGMEAVNDFPWIRATAFVAAGGAMETAGSKVYNASKGNADEKAVAGANAGGSKTNVVNAPVTTNNNTTQVQMRPPIRNEESSQSRYAASRYA
jgi:hypothetical protein